MQAAPAIDRRDRVDRRRGYGILRDAFSRPRAAGETPRKFGYTFAARAVPRVRERHVDAEHPQRTRGGLQ